MCGRYYVNERTERDVLAMFGGMELPFRHSETGEIRPSECVLVMIGTENETRAIRPEVMRWGFEYYDPQRAGKKTLVINARVESLLEKTMFRNAALYRRCVVVASGYFEWNREKEKVTFDREDGKSLYMAGIYQKYEDGNHVVIVTTKANSSVEPVHDRMPLILEEHEIELWLYDEMFLRYVQNKVPVSLARHQEYEQQCMVFT